MSSKNPLDLHPERLGTTDEKGHRVYLHPEDVTGFFRKWRNVAYWVLIALMIVTPWLTINGNQAILLDIPGRKFHILGLTIYGHNAPMLFFLFFGFAISIAMITSIWGRVWCGWACPQTVTIDALFRRIEYLIEGGARGVGRLDDAPWNGEKLYKRSLKWFCYTLLSLLMTLIFTSYFVEVREFWHKILHPSMEYQTLYFIILIITTIFLFYLT